MYAENCDKSVMKRLLKQLWRIVMKSLERNIVLPPINEKVLGKRILVEKIPLGIKSELIKFLGE